MIYVKRGDAPSDFTQYAAFWQEEFQTEKRRYSASEFWTKIRKRKKMKYYAMVLFSVFNRKCAYCESKMAHVSPAHIEHYRPKSDERFVTLMFDWNNLFISCPACNTSKGNKFPECNGHTCLIDPTHEEPSEHLEFCSVQVVGKTRRGEHTISLVNLRRSELEEQRGIWLLIIDALLLLLKNPEACDEARMFLIWAIQSAAPYTAMTRCYLSGINPSFVRNRHPKVTIDEPMQRIRRLVDIDRDDIKKLLC